jgi:stigma-specific protein Stig1
LAASAVGRAGLFAAGLLVAACYAIVGITDFTGSQPADTADVAVAEGGTCVASKILCGTVMIDPLSDSNNCGQCGNACNGLEQCVSGYCLVPFYIGPGGHDNNDGLTPDAAVLSFDQLFPTRIAPGRALVLLDGTYGQASTGMIHVDCSPALGANAAQSGTPDKPIVIAALHDRQAVLQSDGVESAISITDCSHYVVDGLTAKSQDAPSDGGTVPDTVAVFGGQDVNLRRL